MSNFWWSQHFPILPLIHFAKFWYSQNLSFNICIQYWYLFDILCEGLWWNQFFQYFSWATFVQVNISLSYHWCTLLNIELVKICHSILLFNVDICLWYYVMGLHKVSLVSSKSFFPQEQCINSCFWVKFTKFDLNYLFTQTRKCSQV